MQILLVGFSHNFVDSLLQKLPHPKNKFGVKTTEKYYNQIRNECEDFVLHNVNVTTIDKILKSLDISKAFGIDHISVKFLNDGALVIANHLANITNLSITLNTFPSKCKVAKKNLCLEKELRLKLKS